MPRTTPTLSEIAADFTLWGEYYDINGHDSREQWEAIGQQTRVQILRDAFGPPEICDECGRNPHDDRGDGSCAYCD